MAQKNNLRLGIHRIQPVDLGNPRIQAALERARMALSNERLADILKVRTAIQSYLSNKLEEQGFLHPPVYLMAGCTDPLNHWTYPARISYYGEELSLTQSLILQKIMLVMLTNVEKVYFASPNIRLEMRIDGKEYKYVTEFMQVDFEQRGATYEQMLDFVSMLVGGLFDHLNASCGEIIEKFRGEALPSIDGRLDVFDAGELLAKWNLSSTDEVERRLSREAGSKPFLLVNLKREAYDEYDEESGRFLNYDVILPPAGANPNPVEVLSGAKRTSSVERLEARMTELGYPLEYFAPFFELFSQLSPDGVIDCAGGGFGVERFTYGVLGLPSIHEVYPFPRPAEGHIAI